MYRGNELKEQRERPFDFEEAVLSPKERARIQRGEGAFNPFQSTSKALVVEEFRISELSARIRTINNARDSMAVLPDGTPLTEVTMYGRRGEVYLLGPFSAVKRVMAGEVPSKSVFHQQWIENTRRSFEATISILESHLIYSKRGGHPWLSFEECTGRGRATVRRLSKGTLVHAGHSFMIESCAKDIADLNGEFPSLEEAIEQWKWWGPWTSEAKDVSDRVAKVAERRDKLIKELLEKMAAEPHSSANDHAQQGSPLL